MSKNKTHGPDCEPDAARHRIVPSAPDTVTCQWCERTVPVHECDSHYDSLGGETFVSCGKCRGDSHSHDVPAFMAGHPLELD